MSTGKTENKTNILYNIFVRTTIYKSITGKHFQYTVGFQWAHSNNL